MRGALSRTLKSPPKRGLFSYGRHIPNLRILPKKEDFSMNSPDKKGKCRHRTPALPPGVAAPFRKIPRFRTLLTSAALAALLPLHALPASASIFDTPAGGWFWYESVPDEAKDDAANKAPVPPETAESADESPRLTVGWLRRNAQKFLDAAIDRPTRENVLAWFYVQRLMQDRASAFAEAAQSAVEGNPLVDENFRRPQASFAQREFDRNAALEGDRLLRSLSKKAGIVFFFRPDCPFCRAMAPKVAALSEEYGFPVLAVSLDGENLVLEGKPLFRNFRADSGQAAMLGVTAVPELFFYTRERGFVRAAAGAMTSGGLRDTILRKASEGGLISPEEYGRTRLVIAQDHEDELREGILRAWRRMGKDQAAEGAAGSAGTEGGKER